MTMVLVSWDKEHDLNLPSHTYTNYTIIYIVVYFWCKNFNNKVPSLLNIVRIFLCQSLYQFGEKVGGDGEHDGLVVLDGDVCQGL